MVEHVLNFDECQRQCCMCGNDAEAAKCTSTKSCHSNAAQRTRKVLELSQKSVVTQIYHPMLADWLGQVLGKEKEDTEGFPDDVVEDHNLRRQGS